MRSNAVVLALALLAAACGRKEAAVSAGDAPTGDVILVTIDTWRADAAGFAGNGKVATPFLDSLAAKGIQFTNAHAHNVVTLPSHVNILTGLNPYQHGVRENAGFVLDGKVQTVAESLQANGYATGAFVAAYPLDARYGLNQGFDVYDDNYGKGRATLDFTVQERSAPAVLASASKWWSSVAGRKRFMWIHLYDPHAPYAPPEPFASEYRDNPYLGEVAAVDRALAETLGPLLTGDTTVIVTADHGEALGDHGELTHGLFAYEATLKVPLVVAGPAVQPRREGAFVRHIDIVPTILRRAGLAVPPELPGQSLLGTIAPRDTYFESLSASLNRGWAPLTGVIRNGGKYIDLPLAEYYELAGDAAEAKNLYRERRREVRAARDLLASLPLATGTRSRITPEEAAQLRSLGYVTGAQMGVAVTEADDPKNLVSLDRKMHQAIETYQRGEPARALVIAREVVAERPKMAAGRELLVFMLQQNERIPEALQELAGMERDGLAGESSRIQRALLLSETGNPAEAVEILGPIVAKGSASAEVLSGYGIALADLGRVPEAVTQFRRALEIDPNHAPALQNMGIVALRANDLQAAEQNLARALELNPRLPLALNSLGVVYARRNDYRRAVELWQRAVAVDPRQYDALFNIGLVETEAGHYAEARRALEHFVRTAPSPRFDKDKATARRALQFMPGR